jgi:hypothetical protein
MHLRKTVYKRASSIVGTFLAENMIANRLKLGLKRFLRYILLIQRTWRRYHKYVHIVMQVLFEAWERNKLDLILQIKEQAEPQEIPILQEKIRKISETERRQLLKDYFKRIQHQKLQSSPVFQAQRRAALTSPADTFVTEPRKSAIRMDPQKLEIIEGLVSKLRRRSSVITGKRQSFLSKEITSIQMVLNKIHMDPEQRKHAKRQRASQIANTKTRALVKEYKSSEQGRIDQFRLLIDYNAIMTLIIEAADIDINFLQKLHNKL